MRCHQHSTNNMLLGAPKDMPNCDTVPATMVIDGDVVIVQTFWRPTEDELKRLNDGQSVCLHVWGNSHPPVAITVESST